VSVTGTPRRAGPREYANGEIVVEWRSELCFHSQRCVKALPRVFDSAKRPWIDMGGASTDEIATAVDGCPSGALRWRRADGTQPPDPETLEVEPMANGPLLVRGPIRVVRADGSSEAMPRAAFCRCGHSNNKPFCDGSHRDVGFRA
jgi:uncharacterized Fe-S cluster protein YjdI